MKMLVAWGLRLTDLRSARSKGSVLFCAMSLLLICVIPERAVAQEVRNTQLLQVEPFDEGLTRRARRAESSKDPLEMLRSARYIYVRSLSALVAVEDIENKLRKHPAFQRYGMLITRMEADADLILEVRRSILTKFVFTAIEPSTLILGASGKLSSLGGTVDGKVASLFMKQVIAARQK